MEVSINIFLISTSKYKILQNMERKYQVLLNDIVFERDVVVCGH